MSARFSAGRTVAGPGCDAREQVGRQNVKMWWECAEWRKCRADRRLTWSASNSLKTAKTVARRIHTHTFVHFWLAALLRIPPPARRADGMAVILRAGVCRMTARENQPTGLFNTSERRTFWSYSTGRRAVGHPTRAANTQERRIRGGWYEVRICPLLPCRTFSSSSRSFPS
jgi:hypothetical protein